jgi:dienelactone hydrolase
MKRTSFVKPFVPYAAAAFVFVGLLVTTAFAQLAPQDPEAVAEGVVSDLAARQFTKVASQFNEAMQAALPAEELSRLWDTMTTLHGAFQQIVGTRVDERAGYQVVRVMCVFKRDKLDIEIALDAHNRIGGMHVLPASDTPEKTGSGTAPKYAKLDSFHETEVTVESGPWKLPGLLTLPNGKGPFTAIVLVHGSGPQDADETIGPNKPFKDLAWGLASEGIAVLRYVKRTKQYSSQAAQPGVPFTVREETVDDARAAVALLSKRAEIEPAHIYVLGHSLGATLAPRIAAGDPQVAGIIIAAGIVRPLEVVIVEQLKYIASLPGPGRDELNKQVAEAERAKTEIESPSLKPDTKVNIMGVSIPGSYFLDLRDYRPAQAAAELKVPILVLQGGRDYQVTKDDYDLWKKALANDPLATFKFYPDLFHLFMKGQGSGPGSPADYSVEGHVSEIVINDIAQWVRQVSR